ncbi:hypothetical protein CVT26_005199, partial [Gymnopilus dilepis]
FSLTRNLGTCCLNKSREAASPLTRYREARKVKVMADNTLEGVVCQPKTTTIASPFVAGRGCGGRDQRAACTHTLTHRRGRRRRLATRLTRNTSTARAHAQAGGSRCDHLHDEPTPLACVGKRGGQRHRRLPAAWKAHLRLPLQWEGDGGEVVSRKGRSSISGSLLPGEGGGRERRRVSRCLKVIVPIRNEEESQYF